jgi:hypothetical protein
VTDLTEKDLVEMTTPTWERAKAAIRAGDADAAIDLVDKGVAQWHSLQEYSINWITSTLSFIADELGEEATSSSGRGVRQTFSGVTFPRECVPR